MATAMTMIADTLHDLKVDEGTVLHAYQDSLGYWTIGTGRLIDVRRGGGISQSESDILLANDVEGRLAYLSATYPWFSTLDPVRQSALVNLAFNLGIEGLASFHHTLAAIAKQDWDAVAAGLRHSTWFTQVQPTRTGRIIRMMRTGMR